MIPGGHRRYCTHYRCTAWATQRQETPILRFFQGYFRTAFLCDRYWGRLGQRYNFDFGYMDFETGFCAFCFYNFTCHRYDRFCCDLFYFFKGCRPLFNNTLNGSGYLTQDNKRNTGLFAYCLRVTFDCYSFANLL